MKKYELNLNIELNEYMTDILAENRDDAERVATEMFFKKYPQFKELFQNADIWAIRIQEQQ